MEDSQTVFILCVSLLCYSYLYENLLEIFLMKGMMYIEKAIGEDH